jgi:colicin import membrane protein
MGNPASVKRKKTEKRRKRYEDRLGPGVYLPKDERLKLNAEMEKFAEAEKARLAKVKKEREERRAKKAAEKKAKPATAEKKEDKKEEKSKEEKK